MTERERMHRLLENFMVGRPMRRFADEKLQADATRLPLAAVYNDEADGTLVVGMTRESQEDRKRHEQTLDRLSQLIGGKSGASHRLAYLSVYRDFKIPTIGGNGSDGSGVWDDGMEGQDDEVGKVGKVGKGHSAWNTPGTAEQALRGGLSLGCAGMLCLVYSFGRGQRAAIVSSHTIGPATGAKIFGPEQSSASKRAARDITNEVGRPVGRPSVETVSEVVAVVTTNPALHVRASDSALALLTNRHFSGRDHSIWQASGREYHVTSYVSSIETPLETKVAMQSMGSKGRSVTTRGCIRHKQCTLRDAWGTLTDQVLADYEAHPGGSGAPIFIARRGADEVGFVGIHVGRIVEESGRSFSFYSAWEAVKLELQLPAPRW